VNALAPDRDQVETFVNALFKHAGTEGFASCRSFPDSDSDKPFSIKSAFLKGGLKHVVDIAVHEAENAANASLKVVFCPPVATFKGTRQKGSWQAREKDLLRGLALSVECDERAQAARARLEKLLGVATIVTLSGGQWTDSETGEVHPKLHLHWRLQTPAEGEASLVKLKRARDLATRLVGGDPTNKAICHPIRWPGSWHRKGEPVLCRVETANLDCEIDLDAALTVLTAASDNGPDKPQGRGTSSDPHDVPSDTDEELIAGIHSGRTYHGPLVQLAARSVGRGWSAERTIKLLQDLMDGSVGERDKRWHDRVASIRGIVASAVEKYGERAKDEAPKRLVLPLQWHGDAPWQPPKWMIRNRLPETGAGLLVGQWGMLKTFMALDLSAHVMLGWEWTGEPVYRQSGVPERVNDFETAQCGI
jgi:AAA domain